MKMNRVGQRRIFAAASLAAMGVLTVGAWQPARAQSATTMDVYGKAMQIFMWVAQNGNRIDTPDGKAGPCRDPWVSSSFRMVFGREANASGDTGECNFKNFGGGNWSSYRDLVWKTAWYRAYRELGMVRGGNALNESLSTPAGIEPLVQTAVVEVVNSTRGTATTRGASTSTEKGYADLKAQVEDVYYSCSDSGISKAIISVTGRAPRGLEDQGECNPMLYGKGKWKDYEDLQDKVRKTLVAKPFRAGECRDAEVGRAVKDVRAAMGMDSTPSGMGELGECNSSLYGNGHWSSYADLKAKVSKTLSDLKAANVQLQPDNSIKAARMERGGGGGVMMALMAAASAYMQWKAMQPPKQSRNQGNMQQGGMDGGMMQPQMQQPQMQMQQGGMMQQPQMQQQQMPVMIQPGAQMPMMAPMQQQMMPQQMMQQPMQQPQMQMQNAPMIPGMN